MSPPLTLRILNSIHLPSGAVFSILTGSSRCSESEDFPKRFGRQPQHLLSRRSHLRRGHLHPVWRHFGHRGFVGRAAWRHGALGSLRESIEILLEPAWGCGRFILVVVSRLGKSCLMDLLAQRFLNSQTNRLAKMLQTMRWLRWTTGVAIMPRILTSNHLPSGAVFSILDHPDGTKVRVSASSSAEPPHLLGRRSNFRIQDLHPVWWHSDHRRFIGQNGRRPVHLGAPSGEFEMLHLYSWLWGCVVCWF